MMTSGRPHPLVLLARESIISYLSGGAVSYESLPEGFSEPAGAFVSLKKGDQLRGCIGTISPVKASLFQEVAENAVSAAARDPRFAPVTLDELDEINITVDVLGNPEPASGPDELDPSRYGVIVKSGWKKGVLLPDLPGITRAEEQIAIARQKAGIGEGEEVELLRFEVERYR